MKREGSPPTSMPEEVEFDRIAPIYDETRPRPSEGELGALTALFSGCRTVLDAGVGTGRFAAPLRSHGFEVIGIDLSLGMMRRARAKGVPHLVRATLFHLPLADRSVDAAFMAHVLQLLPDASRALRELGRVARRHVVVQLPEWLERSPPEAWRIRRARYVEPAAEMGYPVPERGQRYRYTLEDLSAMASPTAVHVVPLSRAPGENTDERLSRWAAEMIGGGHIPPEVHGEILRRLRAEFLADPSGTDRPRTARFIAWDPVRLRAGT